jgi:hypothetical protein
MIRLIQNLTPICQSSKPQLSILSMMTVMNIITTTVIAAKG